jgi:hypothetical protein
MELEAYMTDFKIDMELGMGAGTRPWDKKVYRRFQGGLDDFMDWLLKEYKDNRSLLRMSAAEYAKAVEKQANAARRRVRRHEKSLAEAQAALEHMRAAGHPEAQLANYEAAELTPLREKLRQDRIELAWSERDLALLKDPKSLRRYRAYSRRVMELARRTHEEFNAR